MGDCSVHLRGANQPVQLHGELFNAKRYLLAGEVKIGTIAVTDQLFEATIVPYLDTGCFLIRNFGFSPLLPAGEETELDPESIERLRALGYLD